MSPLPFIERRKGEKGEKGEKAKKRKVLSYCFLLVPAADKLTKRAPDGFCLKNLCGTNGKNPTHHCRRLAVEYSGRLTTRLPYGIRTILIKDDGTILIHADKGSETVELDGHTEHYCGYCRNMGVRGRLKTAGKLRSSSPHSSVLRRAPRHQTWYVDNAKPGKI